MRPRVLMLALVVAAAGGCAERPVRHDATHESISAELDKAIRQRTQPAAPDTVSQALLPPLVVEMPRAGGKPLDQRFDLNVNNAPAAQVFMAIVSGTRFSMVVHPEVRDAISVNLKDVTVLEALDTLRDLYGYEYRVQGTGTYQDEDGATKSGSVRCVVREEDDALHVASVRFNF